MKIFFDNVNVGSSSGPNSFGKKLIEAIRRKGHEAATTPNEPDVQLSFIQTTRRIAPLVALRLDGIYFNSRQDWESLNAPIMSSFVSADLIIYQTHFNRRLTEKYFGASKRHVVIGNGTDIDVVSKIPRFEHPDLDRFEEVWCCSSSWRPHKRLRDNIDYFLQMRQKNTGLIVLGENPDHIVNHPDILYAGRQSWEMCISVYKRAKKFIHLAFLDHCPNVVVDARAAGCDLVIASSGGTKEVAGLEATVIQDIDWDLRPLDLYSPPSLDFTSFHHNRIESTIDIDTIADKYISHLSAL